MNHHSMVFLLVSRAHGVRKLCYHSDDLRSSAHLPLRGWLFACRLGHPATLPKARHLGVGQCSGLSGFTQFISVCSGRWCQVAFAGGWSTAECDMFHLVLLSNCLTGCFCLQPQPADVECF